MVEEGGFQRVQGVLGWSNFKLISKPSQKEEKSKILSCESSFHLNDYEDIKIGCHLNHLLEAEGRNDNSR